MKALTKKVIQFVLLLVVSLGLVGLSWIIFTSIENGINSHLMGFEREPQEGWNYWRWFFIKRNLLGIAVELLIIALLSILLARSWFRFWK